MADHTHIEWCDYSYNPWWGCSKVAGAPECEMCYAADTASRKLHERHAGVAAHGNWTGKFTRSSDAVRFAPLKWRKPGFVFWSSMSDIWHEHVPLEWLDEGLDMVDQTPHLTWLLLSKRPGNAMRKLAALGRRWPDNAWAGATIGHPKSLPLLKPLLAIPAPMRFLSCEPLLAPLIPGLALDGIGWVISGGESPSPFHPHARRCHPDWVRALRNLCAERGVAFFLKQWGLKSNNPTPWPEELDQDAKGGATLDGRLWREWPM